MKRTTMPRPLRVLLTVAALCGTLFLASCDDGDEVVTGGTLSGTAAVGAPLANATVSILCNTGGAPKTATTGTDGKYTATVDCAPPYMLKVTGLDTTVSPAATVTLYAFADAVGNVNITPFTDIAASLATKNDPAGEYAAVMAASKKADALWNTAVKADALTKINTLLGNLGLSSAGISDLLNGVFNAKPGDKTDDLLESLKTKRGGVPLSSLVEQVGNFGGQQNGKPWLALFPAQQSFKLTAGAETCWFRSSVTENSFPLNAVTATFTLNTTGFAVSAQYQATGTTTISSFAVDLSSIEYHSYSVFAGNLSFFASTASEQYGVSVRQGKSLSEIPTESVNYAQGLSLYNNATGSIECNSTLPLMTLASRPAFKTPARMAAILGTATNVVSPAEGCRARDTVLTVVPEVAVQLATTYTYAISPLVGDVKFNGVSLAPDWLSLTEARYEEQYYPAGADQRLSRVHVQTGITGVSFTRYSTGEFNHSCFFDN